MANDTFLQHFFDFTWLLNTELVLSLSNVFFLCFGTMRVSAGCIWLAHQKNPGGDGTILVSPIDKLIEHKSI